MKNLSVLFILCCFCIQMNAQTTTIKTINVNGVTRSYRIYIPASYQASSALFPLVFNFHGYSSNAFQQEFYGDFRPVADTANFILVHPEGLLIAGTSGFNNFSTIGSLPDDIGFIDHLIDTLNVDYHINLNKVYSTGFSNGGFMSYDLACLLSNRFAAIASVSGSMVTSHLTACNVSHPTPIMQIHGTNDATVSYNGTGGIIASTHIDSLIKWWVLKNNCTPTPTMTNVPNTSTIDGCTAERYVYSGGNKGSTVEFYKVISGAHTWPGAGVAIGVTNQDFNASKEIWRFFNQYSLNQLTNPSSIQEEKTSIFSFSPNPTQGNLKLNCSSSEIFDFEIYTNLGVKVLMLNELSNGMNINLKSLENGIYFYKIKSKNYPMKVGKIVKI
jgi:polyhydroxybutyrate depolymerase